MAWAEKALHSEIEYSKGYGGKPTKYKNFIHIFNSEVPYGGDFNRVVAAKISDFKSFNEVVKKTESIHKKRNLGKPNRYDICPPVLDTKVWDKYLSKKGFRLGEAVFFCSKTKRNQMPAGFSLYSPAHDEYLQWYHARQKTHSYFNEKWFKRIWPAQSRFIETFKPYWLLKDKKIKGWVYCANFGEYCRLFEVEIKDEFRGRGFGKILLTSIKIEAGKQGAEFVLLQSNERLRRFYENIDFVKCSANSIIWLKC